MKTDFVYIEGKDIHKSLHNNNIKHIHLRDGRIRLICRGISNL